MITENEDPASTLEGKKTRFRRFYPGAYSKQMTTISMWGRWIVSGYGEPTCASFETEEEAWDYAWREIHKPGFLSR